MRSIRLGCLIGIATLLFVLGYGTGANAQVKVGDFITPENADKVKDLVAPGVLARVRFGMTMRIVASERIEWPPPYKEATEKYSGQVRLAEDRKTIVGYVAGQPFPLLDANDPDVAVKIMWNARFRPIATDDYDLRFFDCYQQYMRPGQEQFQISYYQVGHYAGYSLVGRVEVEPMPIDPTFKESGAYYLFALYPVLAPTLARGQGVIKYQYADPTRADDSWSYNPGSRRVRRLNEATLSIATTPASAWNPDHYGGFQPKIQWYDYKFLGEKRMLACVNAKTVPAVTCPTDGGASTCPEDWEMRPLYIVEANPDWSKANPVQGKRVVYNDSEIWFNPYIDAYDRRGELFQNFTYWLTHRDRVVPDARIAIYPFKRSFVVAAGAFDLQGGSSSHCYLPGKEVPERECWYINMGAVDKQFFLPSKMQAAAQVFR
jgi:hypothetical protein